MVEVEGNSSIHGKGIDSNPLSDNTRCSQNFQ